jgi:hypothetical protein
VFSVAQYTVEESQSAYQLLFSSLFCCFYYHKSNTHQPLFGTLKAIKVRLYPTPEQADFLNQQLGAVRKVYNLGLVIMQNRYRHH